MKRAVLALLLIAGATVSAAPWRHMRYAESERRSVYAFVFGSRDTCRVYRRTRAATRPLDELLRFPYGADHRGEPGAKLLAEFNFGRTGRPLHLYPTESGKYLINFGNRTPDGAPGKDDRVHHLSEDDDYFEYIEWEGLPAEEATAFPEFARALTHPKPLKPPPPGSWIYSFLVREAGPDRIAVARQSEGSNGLITEIRFFVITIEGAKAVLPTGLELGVALKSEEPLWRAGAAWVIGRNGKEVDQDPLREAAPTMTGTDSAYRAAFWLAQARCGDAEGRARLRELAKDPGDPHAALYAARALVALGPEKADADAFVAALMSGRAEASRLGVLGLARLGPEAYPAVNRMARSGKTAYRLAAARALGWIDTPKAEERLLVLARDGDATVQTEAAVALTDPPRAILPENHAEFARALDACRFKRNDRAGRRLSVLAAHAKIHHKKVLEALVKLAPSQPKAIWALAKLTGQEFATAKDCADWWKAERAR